MLEDPMLQKSMEILLLILIKEVKIELDQS
jgi:hypothetical protein